MSSARLWIGVLVVALASGPEASGKDLVFRGSLEKVTREALSILLPNGIIIDARIPKRGPLSAESLSDDHYVGDAVEISCETISPVYDGQADLYRHLELKAFRPLDARIHAEQGKALKSRVWREAGNLLKPRPTATVPRLPVSSGPTTGEAAMVLERARSVNLALSRSLPNFVADEMVRRYRNAPRVSVASRPDDSFFSEISVQGSRETRQRILKDGKPWLQPFAAIPGFRWFAGFGTQLGPLFSPACPTSFEFEGRQVLSDRQVWIYRYRSQADSCFYYFDSVYQRYYPELTGRVFIDGVTGSMVRYEEKAINFPAEFFYRQAEKEITWEDVRIGQEAYLLPVSARFLVRFSKGDTWSVNVEYRNHRHFEVSSKLLFGKPLP